MLSIPGWFANGAYENSARLRNNPRALVTDKRRQSVLISGYEIIGLARFRKVQEKSIARRCRSAGSISLLVFTA